jgi:hypothetical protein
MALEVSVSWSRLMYTEVVCLFDLDVTELY